MVSRSRHKNHSQITFSSASCQFRIGFDPPSFHHWHSTGCHRFCTLFHFNQAHAAISSDCQTLMVAETWDLNADLGSGLQAKKIDIQFVPRIHIEPRSRYGFYSPAIQWCLAPPKHFDRRQTLRFSRVLWLALMRSYAHLQ